MARARAGAASSEKLRDGEVLATATRVFHDRGYASSSVQLIADELGILKGSLYYYTRSKEDLLYRILRGVYEDLGQILVDVESSDAAPLERLHVYIQRQVEYATRNLQAIAIYYRDADQLSQEHRDAIKVARRSHERFLRGLIEAGQADGSIVTDRSAAVLADLLFGSFIWTYRWFDPAGKASAAEVAQAAADFGVRAVRA